jgi:hypothetical protein
MRKGRTRPCSTLSAWRSAALGGADAALVEASCSALLVWKACLASSSAAFTYMNTLSLDQHPTQPDSRAKDMW